MSSSSLTSYDPSLSLNAISNPPKLVSFAEIEATLVQLLGDPQNVERLFFSQKEAFRQSTMEATERGDASYLPIQTAGQPPQPSMSAGEGAQLCIKTGYTKNGHHLVTKIAAGGGTNTGNTGCVFVTDQSTLRLSTILCDEGLLTEVRTAAACVFASKFTLGAEKMSKINKIGIVGGGVQAIWQLRLLAAVISKEQCRTVVVKTTSAKSAQAFIEKMASSSYPPDREWTFELYSLQGNRFRECQLIHTLTPARAPVLFASDVCIGNNGGCDEGEETFLHITAVGADSVGKQELDRELIKKADVLLCDSIPQAKERGEFQSLEFEKSIVELGSVVESTNTDSGLHPKLGVNFTIFDSSGLALQDVNMAYLVSLLVK